MTYDVVAGWLKRAELLAGVPHLGQALFKAYRSKWATEREGYPIQDVMAAGGWSDPSCIQTIYQQSDAATLFKVVSEPAELREVKSS